MARLMREGWEDKASFSADGSGLSLNFWQKSSQSQGACWRGGELAWAHVHGPALCRIC